MWRKANYYAVFDKDERELFRGSETACHKWAHDHGGHVSKVILEWTEQEELKV